MPSLLPLSAVSGSRSTPVPSSQSVCSCQATRTRRAVLSRRTAISTNIRASGVTVRLFNQGAALCDPRVLERDRRADVWIRIHRVVRDTSDNCVVTCSMRRCSVRRPAGTIDVGYRSPPVRSNDPLQSCPRVWCRLRRNGAPRMGVTR